MSCYMAHLAYQQPSLTYVNALWMQGFGLSVQPAAIDFVNTVPNSL